MKIHRLLAAFAAAVTVGAVGMGTAAADNLAVDSLQVQATTLDFGSVPCGASVPLSFAANVSRQGGVNNNTYANNAAVTWGVVNPSPELSVSIAPFTLPGNWTTIGNNTLRGPSTAPKVTVTSSTPGAGAAILTFTASGPGATGGTVAKSGTLSVTWNTLSCNTAPEVAVTGVSEGATYTYGSVPTVGCSVDDVEDVGESATPLVTGPASGVGAFSATCSYTDGGGLTASSSRSYTVAKAVPTVTVSCPDSVVYTGGAIDQCTATVTGVGLSGGIPVSYTDNTVVGTATATATFAGDDQHLSATDSKTFAITPAPSTTTVSCPSSVEFTGAPWTPCIAVATGVVGVVLDPAVPVTHTDNVGAGTATASATFAGDANHTGSSDSETFAISKAPAVVTIDCGPGPHVYGAAALTPCTARATGTGGLDLVLDVTYADNTDAGTATAQASFAGDADHESSSDTTTFEIQPAPVSVDVTCGTGPFVYDGSAHEPCTATATAPGLDLDLVVGYTNNTNAGTATGSASFPTGGNYVGASETASFTIDRADTVTAVACPDHVIWTGSALEPCAASVTGPGGLSDSVPVAYEDNLAVGTATATAGFAGSGNHKPSSDTTTFEVRKAPSVVSVSCDPTSVEYTGAAHTPCSARVTGAGGLDLPVSVAYTGNVDAGTATASAAWPGDANHTDSSGSETFTITKAPSTTTVTCPIAPLEPTGLPQTPCTAFATGVGLEQVPLVVSYTNNIGGGTATASATWGGDANHTGSSATGSFTITSWTRTGFYQPVDMGGVYNVVRAGSTVPLKFDVHSGATELTSTTAVKSFTQQAISCSGAVLTDEIEVTTTGGTSLRYTGEQFVQNWQTPKQAGACYKVTMTTLDLGTLVAYFRLK